MLITKEINWTFVLVEGIILTLLGIFALVNPYVTALSLELILGWILVISGIIQGVRALSHLKQEGSITLLALSAVALITGILLLTYPMSGILTLSLLLTVFFIIDGIGRVVNSFEIRPIKGWGWVLFSGIISLLLAFLIISGWPVSGVWIIGVYLGIYLIFLGIALVTLAYAAKNS